MYDIAIIGAGIIGAMAASELSKYDVKICMLEKCGDVAMGATKANSAIVHAGFDAKPGTLKALLNVRGSKMMEETAARLGVKYQKNGALVIGFTDEDSEIIRRLCEQGNANGVRGLCILNKDELRQKEANISKDANCALYAPSSAIICPYELCIAAAGNAMDNGADLKLNFKVTDIKSTGEFYEISSDSETVKAKYIINAAGLFSDEIARLAGDNSFSVHPRKGEYILLDNECSNLSRCTIFRTPTEKGKGILLSPTVDGNYIAGPTAVDISDKTDKATTAQGFARIIKEALENLDNIPFGKSITSFCGLRAVGSTGDFIINAYENRFINAAGIESPGLSASPAIAEYIVSLLKKCGLNLQLKSDYIKTRKPYHYFKNVDTEEKNRIIKERPEFGRVICRCESVTEGEIIDAIRRNPGARDIDGIKRRTRAGMGRCQSGFCLPSVAEILADELGVPFDSITKNGGNSKIVVGKTKGEQK